MYVVYEFRTARNGVWSDWALAPNPDGTAGLFDRNEYITDITYTYKDGSQIEYRRKDVPNA